MKYLGDTNLAIDLLNGHPDAVALEPTLLRDGLALSIVTYMELLDGVYRSRDPRAAEAGLMAFLRGVTILLFSRRAAERTARLRGQLRSQKRPIDHRALHIIIAGTGLAHGLTVVTSDKDFDDIPGLTTLNPRTGALVTH